MIVAIGTSMIVATVPTRGAGSDAQLLKDAQRVFTPLPKNAATADSPITPERVELGRKLFFDPRISVDGTVVKAIPGYSEMFRKAFPAEPDPVTIGNWGKAIGAYA